MPMVSCDEVTAGSLCVLTNDIVADQRIIDARELMIIIWLADESGAQRHAIRSRVTMLTVCDVSTASFGEFSYACTHAIFNVIA